MAWASTRKQLLVAIGRRVNVWNPILGERVMQLAPHGDTLTAVAPLDGLILAADISGVVHITDDLCYEHLQTIRLCDGPLPTGVMPTFHFAFVLEAGCKMLVAAGAQLQLMRRVDDGMALQASAATAGGEGLSGGGGGGGSVPPSAPSSPNRLPATTPSTRARAPSSFGPYGDAESDGPTTSATALVVCVRLQRVLAAVGRDVRAYDMASGEALSGAVDVAAEDVSSLAVAPDERTAFVGSYAGELAQLLLTATGVQVYRRLSSKLSDADVEIAALSVVSSWGATAEAAAKRPAASAAASPPPPQQRKDPEVERHGALLLALGSDGTMLVISALEGALLATVRHPSMGEGAALAVSASAGALVATGGSTDGEGVLCVDKLCDAASVRPHVPPLNLFADEGSVERMAEVTALAFVETWGVHGGGGGGGGGGGSGSGSGGATGGNGIDEVVRGPAAPRSPLKRVAESPDHVDGSPQGASPPVTSAAMPAELPRRLLLVGDATSHLLLLDVTHSGRAPTPLHRWRHAGARATWLGSTRANITSRALLDAATPPNMEAINLVERAAARAAYEKSAVHQADVVLRARPPATASGGSDEEGDEAALRGARAARGPLRTSASMPTVGRSSNPPLPSPPPPLDVGGSPAASLLPKRPPSVTIAPTPVPAAAAAAAAAVARAAARRRRRCCPCSPPTASPSVPSSSIEAARSRRRRPAPPAAGRPSPCPRAAADPLWSGRRTMRAASAHGPSPSSRRLPLGGSPSPRRRGHIGGGTGGTAGVLALRTPPPASVGMLKRWRACAEDVLKGGGVAAMLVLGPSALEPPPPPPPPLPSSATAPPSLDALLDSGGDGGGANGGAYPHTLTVLIAACNDGTLSAWDGANGRPLGAITSNGAPPPRPRRPMRPSRPLPRAAGPSPRRLATTTRPSTPWRHSPTSCATLRRRRRCPSSRGAPTARRPTMPSSRASSTSSGKGRARRRRTAPTQSASGGATSSSPSSTAAASRASRSRSASARSCVASG